MIKRISKKKKKKEVVEPVKTNPLGVAKVIDDEVGELKLDTSVSDFSEDVEITRDVLQDIAPLDKNLSVQMRVSEKIDNLEDSIVDGKNFSISDTTKKNAEESTHDLASLLKTETAFLKDNQFILQRLKKTISRLEDIVGRNKITKDFDASILELKTIIGQVSLEKLQRDNDDNVEIIDLSYADTTELQPDSSPKVKVEKYIDNREKSTSVASAEELDFLKESGIVGGSVDLQNLEITSETREYLEQSNRIKGALEEKSTHLISGQLRFLSAEERSSKEAEEFMGKFLADIRRPSIYEMSIQELQIFAVEKGLKHFEGMSRNELLSFVENPLKLYGEQFITQNPYVERLKVELADNQTLRDDVTLSEAKVVESLKAAKAYTTSAKTSAITWQALFIVALILVIAAVVGILVYFLAFSGIS